MSFSETLIRALGEVPADRTSWSVRVFCFFKNGDRDLDYLKSLIYLSMQLQLFDIMPTLLPYVKVICTMECDQEADNTLIRVLPDTCVEIFLNYTISPVAIIDSQLYERSIVSFRMDRYVDVQMRKGAGCVAVCFYPGMAAHFFKLTMGELANTTMPLYELWNLDAQRLEDQLAQCNSTSMRVEILQHFLIAQLSKSTSDTVVVQCLRHIQFANGRLSVGQVNKYSGFSQRQLSRKFHQDLGLSPRAYLRVSRFLSSLKYLNKYPARSLTQVAHESGYYDQAHFIRDYKEFTGYTPGMLLMSDHVLY